MGFCIVSKYCHHFLHPHYLHLLVYLHLHPNLPFFLHRLHAICVPGAPIYIRIASGYILSIPSSIPHLHGSSNLHPLPHGCISPPAASRRPSSPWHCLVVAGVAAFQCRSRSPTVTRRRPILDRLAVLDLMIVWLMPQYRAQGSGPPNGAIPPDVSQTHRTHCRKPADEHRYSREPYSSLAIQNTLVDFDRRIASCS